MRLSPFVLLAVALTSASAPLAAQQRAGGSTARATSQRGDSVDVVATVSRFHEAMARGDSAGVLELLAADLVVLESGDLETRDEYRRHHLPADIAFSRAIAGTRTLARVAVQGDVAWLSATSVTTGRFRDRAIDSAGAELMVLSREGRGAPWRIRAIHWSSHPRKRGA